MPCLETRSSSSPNPKTAMTVAKLRESFSLRPETETRAQSFENTKHSSPGQRKLQTFFRVSWSPKKEAGSGKKSTHGTDMDSSKSLLPCGNVEKLAGRTDSGYGSTSGESDVGLRTPESGGCFSNESVASSPDEKSHVSKEEIQRDVPEINRQMQSSECNLNQSKKPELAPEVTCSSPDAKRRKIAPPLSQVGSSPERNDAQNSVVLSQYDVPLEVEKKVTMLEFSMSSLTARVKKLVQQQQEMAEVLNYRKFRAKISPGENKSAEDELRKEIRYFRGLCSTSVS